MAEAHVSTELPLPADEAWKLLSDLSRFDQWLTIHDEWKSEIPELAVGAHVKEQIVVMGMKNVVDWAVAAYDPPRSLTISGAGMAGAQIAFTLSVAGEGSASTVSVAAEFTGQMIVGPISAAVEKNAKEQLEASLAKLRELAA
ncbi:MAG: polyketide cyclase [Pseudonocardiales bacterium]|nr:MAG: polyketide cyclase [Pseudonocardiales bacterium]